jgi:hypothetical protein
LRRLDTFGLPPSKKEHIMNISIMEAVMADCLEQGSVRDARGRFVAGQSGNPAGKVPGTRNRATLLRAALDGEDGPAMARVVIDKALAGDAVTARFVLDRLEPRPRSRPVEIGLPGIDLSEGARARDVLAAFDATVRAMASGEITPDEAVQVTRVLDGRLRAIEAARREEAREERSTRDAPRAEPSPACGRGQGEGTGAPANQEWHCHSTQPSPRPSPASGRGSKGASFAMDLLHSTCIGRFPSLSPGLEAGGGMV